MSLRYLKTVFDYVDMNPGRAKLLPPDQPMRADGWSRWPEYLKAPGKRWPWLRVNRLLSESRIPQDSGAGRRELERAVEERRAAAGADYKAIRRGWCFGAKAFRQELLAQLAEPMGAEHFGAERLEADVEKAERLVHAELKARRWQETDLAKWAKGDPGKVKLAGPTAGGDVGDSKVDCGAVAHGNGGLCEQPVVSLAQGNPGVNGQA